VLESVASEAPFVSVVMPIRNEANYIYRSLSAVMLQDYPPDRMEVIVADGASTDATLEIVKSLQSDYSNLRLINNPGRVAATGLNQAISQAQGEIIIRVDGHCEIARDYVHRCVGHLRNGEVDVVGGPLQTVGEGYIACGIALAMSSRFGVGGSAFRTLPNATMLTDTVAFPAFTKAAIERAGPFDEELVRNQDDEYNYRLRKMGARILLAANVQCRYYSRSSLWSLWRQYFQYGYWKVRVMQKHPRQMRLRQIVPAAFAAALLMSLLIMPFSVVAGWSLALVLSSYLLANLASSLQEARKDWKLLPLLPPAFAILHLSYGLGFLVGLVRFSGWWRTRSDSLGTAFSR
jgi:glycosyltransferase involved in cell wall biosynthesis